MPRLWGSGTSVVQTLSQSPHAVQVSLTHAGSLVTVMLQPCAVPFGGGDAGGGQNPDTRVALEAADVDFHAAGGRAHLGEIMVASQDAAADGWLSLDHHHLGPGLSGFECGSHTGDTGPENEHGCGFLVAHG